MVSVHSTNSSVWFSTMNTLIRYGFLLIRVNKHHASIGFFSIVNWYFWHFFLLLSMIPNHADYKSSDSMDKKVKKRPRRWLWYQGNVCAYQQNLDIENYGINQVIQTVKLYYGGVVKTMSLILQAAIFLKWNLIMPFLFRYTLYRLTYYLISGVEYSPVKSIYVEDYC